MHSLGGMTHVDYNRPQAFSYEAWFRLMLELQLGHQALEQAYKRMVFNIVGRNQDDHVKNISFLLDSMTAEWRLAPAYDLTFAAGSGYTARHQMTLGGGLAISRAPARDRREKFSISIRARCRRSDRRLCGVLAAQQ